ncbi:MAG TPA: class I SAM-dependent methyltransferase [Candidatus Obscuribacterales bacterium]
MLQYWDEYFTFGWESNQGPAQTEFFACVALAGLPGPLRALIRQQRLEILDWGCALGDALVQFARVFPESELLGLDLSGVAVEKARLRHPQLHFTTTPLNQLGRQFAVVYTSNCLEHFDQPLEILRQEILAGVRDYLIILVPYLEINRCEGHLVTFDADSFPARLEDLTLLFRREIPTAALPGSSWFGQQELLVYARAQACGLESLIPALQSWQAARRPNRG